MQPIPGFFRYYNIFCIINFQNVACFNGSIQAYATLYQNSNLVCYFTKYTRLIKIARKSNGNESVMVRNSLKK